MFRADEVKISEDKRKAIMKEQWDLDEGIVDLVYLFNELGLKTKYSCQGHGKGDYPYIMFDMEDEKILTQVLKEIYETQNIKKSTLDIGHFYQLFTPYISKGEFIINDSYVWRAEFWKLEDYQRKIDRLARILRRVQLMRLNTILNMDEVVELFHVYKIKIKE